MTLNSPLCLTFARFRRGGGGGGVGGLFVSICNLGALGNWLALRFPPPLGKSVQLVTIVTLRLFTL